jgi:hypothetical protein
MKTLQELNITGIEVTMEEKTLKSGKTVNKTTVTFSGACLDNVKSGMSEIKQGKPCNGLVSLLKACGVTSTPTEAFKAVLLASSAHKATDEGKAFVVTGDGVAQFERLFPKFWEIIAPTGKVRVQFREPRKSYKELADELAQLKAKYGIK